ncbi:MAG: bifunctional riboflavin kinase/FAD synthetase [bacterium]
MRVYRTFEEIEYKKETVLTVGTFDGVHIGHQLIIRNLLNNAKKNNWRPVLLTFNPHPQMVVQRENKKPIKLLTTIEERLELFKKYGLSDVLIIPFSRSFSLTPPEEFVKKYLIEKIGMKKILIGFDHMFGKDRGGNENLLSSMASIYNFEIEKIGPLLRGNEKVSSTKIRENLEKYALDNVNEMLGYTYSVRGLVVKGDGRGRTIGLPTANIKYDENKKVPEIGVYFVKSVIKGEIYYGLANIGTRPTFTDELKTILEVHFIDFDKDVYGMDLKIEFIKFLRHEQKFSNVEMFLEQIEKDKIKALEMIKLF